MNDFDTVRLAILIGGFIDLWGASLSDFCAQTKTIAVELEFSHFFYLFYTDYNINIQIFIKKKAIQERLSCRFIEYLLKS